MKDLFNIKFVDCDIFKKVIYKYMPLSRVLQLLESKELAFIYPELWQDPYEAKYLETDYSAVGFHQRRIFCLCARMDNANEEASWKIYENPGEPLIKISIDSVKFFEYLQEYATANDSDLYVSKVDYQYTTKEINEICKRESPLFNKYIDNMDEEKYIRLMSLKRPAFQYENEIRFFIVPKNEGMFEDSSILKMKVGLDMFTRFTINPCSRIKGDDILSKLKVSNYTSTVECTRNEIKRIYPEAKVFKSGLYSNIKPVERIEI